MDRVLLLDLICRTALSHLDFFSVLNSALVSKQLARTASCLFILADKELAASMFADDLNLIFPLCFRSAIGADCHAGVQGLRRSPGSGARFSTL